MSRVVLRYPVLVSVNLFSLIFFSFNYGWEHFIFTVSEYFLPLSPPSITASHLTLPQNQVMRSLLASNCIKGEWGDKNEKNSMEKYGKSDIVSGERERKLGWNKSNLFLFCSLMFIQLKHALMDGRERKTFIDFRKEERNGERRMEKREDDADMRESDKAKKKVPAKVNQYHKLDPDILYNTRRVSVTPFTFSRHPPLHPFCLNKDLSTFELNKNLSPCLRSMQNAHAYLGHDDDVELEWMMMSRI